MRPNLLELLLVLLPLSHMNSSHILRPLSRELSPCVRLCVSLCLSLMLTHKHPILPLCFCLRVAACLFPLLFCPPLERDWKVYAHSSFHSPVSVLLLAHLHVHFSSLTLSSGLCIQLHREPGSSSSFN